MFQIITYDRYIYLPKLLVISLERKDPHHLIKLPTVTTHHKNILIASRPDPLVVMQRPFCRWGLASCVSILAWAYSACANIIISVGTFSMPQYTLVWAYLAYANILVWAHSYQFSDPFFDFGLPGSMYLTLLFICTSFCRRLLLYTTNQIVIHHQYKSSVYFNVVELCIILMSICYNELYVWTCPN